MVAGVPLHQGLALGVRLPGVPGPHRRDFYGYRDFAPYVRDADICRQVKEFAVAKTTELLRSRVSTPGATAAQ